MPNPNPNQLTNLGHKLEDYARNILSDIEQIPETTLDPDVYREIKRQCFQLLGAAAYLKGPK